MKKRLDWRAVAVVAILSVVAWAGAGSLFTSITSHSTPQLVVEANTALDALEDSIDGTTPMASPIVKGTLTAISTNSATTNVVITVNGQLDGETLANDSVDSDAMDPTQTAFTIVSNANMIVYGSNATLLGTATITGAIVGSSTLDVDSVTVDAGAGVDSQAAGTLTYGASTADRIEIADASVVTDIEGPLMLGSASYASTNAQPLATTAYSVLILANSAVVTNTLANPTAAGQLCYVLGGATNVYFADSGNLDCSGVTNEAGFVIVGANDALTLVGQSATKWIAAGFVNN